MISPTTWVASARDATLQQIIDRPKAVGACVIVLGSAVAAVSAMYSIAAVVAVVAATAIALVAIHLVHLSDLNDARNKARVYLSFMDKFTPTLLDQYTATFLKINVRERTGLPHEAAAFFHQSQCSEEFKSTIFEQIASIHSYDERREFFECALLLMPLTKNDESKVQVVKELLEVKAEERKSMADKILSWRTSEPFMNSFDVTTTFIKAKNLAG